MRTGKRPLVEQRRKRKSSDDEAVRVYSHGRWQTYHLIRRQEFELVREHIGKESTRLINVPVNGEKTWGISFSWKNAERAIMVELKSRGMERNND